MLTKRTVLATAMAAGLTSSLGRVATAQAKEVTVRIGFNPFAGTAGINGIIQQRKLYEKYAAKYGYHDHGGLGSQFIVPKTGRRPTPP